MSCVHKSCRWSVGLVVLVWVMGMVSLGIAYEYKVSLAVLPPVVSQPATHQAKKTVKHESITSKKQRFFQKMRPLVDAENQRVMEQRLFLQTIHEKTELSPAEQTRLDALLQTYRIQRDVQGDVPWDEVWARVDMVPPALVLVQAANESAWGTSRFAREGNNYFGEWCFQQGCGLVPLHRKEGAIHEVKVFPSPQLSVRSYLHNLNTKSAYQALRAIRAQQRMQGQEPTAEALAEGLLRYSERGQAYVESIQKMLEHNRAYM